MKILLKIYICYNLKRYNLRRKINYFGKTTVNNLGIFGKGIGVSFNCKLRLAAFNCNKLFYPCLKPFLGTWRSFPSKY